MKRKIDVSGIPVAARFEMVNCGDPECGVAHMIAFDELNKAIANIAISKNAARNLIKFFQEELYSFEAMK